jgi:hypothetical protein
MIRRILAGAAIAAAAFGLSASAASADVTPGSNEGPNVLTGFQIVDDAAERALALRADNALSDLTVAASQVVNTQALEFSVLSNKN